MILRVCPLSLLLLCKCLHANFLVLAAEQRVEDTPLITQKRRALPEAQDLRDGTVLLKTSSHAYRIPLLRTLFPFAKFRFIVLTRNPLASVNGLMDGWLSGQAYYRSEQAGNQLLGPGSRRPCACSCSCSQLREKTSLRDSWKVRQFISINPFFSLDSGFLITETRQRYLTTVSILLRKSGRDNTLVHFHQVNHCFVVQNDMALGFLGLVTLGFAVRVIP